MSTAWYSHDGLWVITIVAPFKSKEREIVKWREGEREEKGERGSRGRKEEERENEIDGEKMRKRERERR